MKNQAIKFNEQRVLTTRFLANFLGVTPSLITSVANGNYNSNKIFAEKHFDNLTEGIDCILLKGSDRLSFVDDNLNAYLDISRRGGRFRIFTKQGVVKMARNLKRLNLYYQRIYKYFLEDDLTEFYKENEFYFTKGINESKKGFLTDYKNSSIQIQLDQMNNRLKDLSDKVDKQNIDMNLRLAFLEQRIDKILGSKFGINFWN